MDNILHGLNEIRNLYEIFNVFSKVKICQISQINSSIFICKIVLRKISTLELCTYMNYCFL